MLPRHVIVRETGGRKVEIPAVDPAASMVAIEIPSLAAIAEQVRRKLKDVVERF